MANDSPSKISRFSHIIIKKKFRQMNIANHCVLRDTRDTQVDVQRLNSYILCLRETGVPPFTASPARQFDLESIHSIAAEDNPPDPKNLMMVINPILAQLTSISLVRGMM